MPEFKIEGNDVFFKEGAMPSFSHFGRLYTAVPTGVENQYEIKKFQVETGQYEHTNDLTEFVVFNEVVSVVDGYCTAEAPQVEEAQEEVQPTNGEILQKLQEQEEANLNRDELMLEQQLLLLNIELNMAI